MTAYVQPHMSRRDQVDGSGGKLFRARVIAGWLLMPSGVIILIAALVSRDAHAWVPAASIALTAVFIGLWAILTARPQAGTGLRLMPVVLAWWSMTFGLASIAWWWPQRGTASIIEVPYVVRALALVGFGGLLMTFAYWAAGQRAGYLFGRPAHTFVDSRSTVTRSWATPLVLSGIALTGRVLIVGVTGQLSYIGSNGTSAAGPLTQLFSMMAALGPLAVLVAGYQVWVERRHAALVSLIAVFSVEAAYAVISGGKQDSVVLGLALVLPWMIARRRVPILFIVLGVLFYAFVLTPFNAQYRAAVRSGPNSFLTSGQAIAEAPSIARDSVGSLLSPDTRQLGTNASYARIREIDNVAITLQKTPTQVAFSSPQDFVLAPLIAVIPRAIWSDKPLLDAGYRFSAQYYGLPPSLRTSSAPTIPGDLYRHGGLLVFGVGMAIFGFALRAVDNLIGATGSAPLMMLMFNLFPLVVKAEIDATGLIATIPSMAILWVASVVLTFGRARERV